MTAEPSAVPPFVAPTAVVEGDVTLSPGSSVWHHAVLRAEHAPVVVGPGTNVQDGCVLHTDAGFPTTLGRDVTVGHRAVLHGCTVEDGVLIGIGAIVLNGATIGEGAIVGAGALVPEGRAIPAGMLAVGIPAKAVRPVTEEERARSRLGARHYRDLAASRTDAR